MKKRFFTVVLLTIILFTFSVTGPFASENLDIGTDNIVQQIAKSMEKEGKSKTAIMDFTNLDGSVSNFGRYLSEKLITTMFRTEKFKVIERRQLNKALEELKFSMSGAVDKASAKEIGKLLSVDAIVIGSISDLIDSVEVNARLIETETGEVFAVASTTMKKDEAISLLMQGDIRLVESKTPGFPKVPHHFTKEKPKLRQSYIALVTTRRGGKFIIKDFTCNNSSDNRKEAQILFVVECKGSKIRICFNEIFSIELVSPDKNTWRLTLYNGETHEVLVGCWEGRYLDRVYCYGDPGFGEDWKISMDNISKIEFLPEK